MIDRRQARAWTLVHCVEGAEWSCRAGDRVPGDAFPAWRALVAGAPG